jgi:hypothetical protein
MFRIFFLVPTLKAALTGLLRPRLYIDDRSQQKTFLRVRLCRTAADPLDMPERSAVEHDRARRAAVQAVVGMSSREVLEFPVTRSSAFETKAAANAPEDDWFGGIYSIALAPPAPAGPQTDSAALSQFRNTIHRAIRSENVSSADLLRSLLS